MTKTSFIKLLIVEDDEDDYILTHDLLKKSELLEFDIEWASSVTQARDLLQKNQHDICLMDYQLGPEVGIDLVKEAIAAGFSSPIIMLTAQENLGVEVDAAKAGAVDYLIKEDLTLEQLLRSIRYALVRSEIQAERFERLKAEAANRSKTYFLANLSHEIRTPLTSIIGYTELLSNQYDKAQPELNSKLEIINRNSKHLLSLLNNTLDLSKIEAGKLEINIIDTAITPFLVDLFSLAQALAQKNKLEFKVLLETKIPEIIKTDPIRLRQILLNLLGNAFKFTDSGKVELTISLNHLLERNFLKFRIKDTGKGIKKAELDSVFNPFVQSSQTPNTNNGTGLGLTISQKLAENLGGFITANSEYGKGSTFTLSIDPGIKIDSYISEVDFKNITTNPSEQNLYNIYNKKILLADDVEDIRLLLGNILTKAGISYESCSNGEEAVNKIHASNEYGLILLDLGMPVMDGYEAIRKLRKLNITTPAIALTAASLQGEEEKCLLAGFDGYLPKPVSTNTLLSTINEVMEKCAKDQEIAGYTPNKSIIGTEQIKILVIEDNTDANLAICQLLELLGYQATGVVNSFEAKQILENEMHGIVLSDIHLKEDNGIELASDIYAVNNKIKIYLMSGAENIDNNLAPDFIAGFIKKPIMLDNLKAILKTPSL